MQVRKRRSIIQTETVDNVDSPLNGKELGSHSSLSSEINLDLSSPQHNKLSPVKSVFERPVSRISFAPEYSNEVVTRGISAQGCRELFDNSWEVNTLEEAVFQEEIALNNLNLNLKRNLRRRRPRLLYLRPPAPKPKLPEAEPETIITEISCPSPAQSPTSPSLRCGDEDECAFSPASASFTALELLTGNNKVGCDTCTERINGQGRQDGVHERDQAVPSIEQPPAVLILHLKRFQLGPRCMFPRGPAPAGRRFLPGRVRDDDSELSDTNQARRRRPPAARWYYVSDSMVSEVSEEKVLRAQAYLLFYERVL
ncbi:unnamed protein product [Danaus chrysippus]|uniref:(African queen) hypothetical protein n=1 Tax=Danaus chrysippus TaxID=151541 RepID=A0A8J2QKR8_9NEOP|nr:unnamed protein product [Danaus chrysippus]